MDSRRISQPARSVVVASVVAVAFLIYLWATSSSTGKELIVHRAIAVLSGNSSPGVTGTVIFEQHSESSSVTITGNLKSLSPGLHGFHIHQLGDITNGCESTGPHFNPYGMTHGAPASHNRHVGDLGNIQSDDSETATFTFSDNLISLNGARSILGRAVVVHAGTDDLGVGGNEESLKTGNAGPRLACGIIGVANSE